VVTRTPSDITTNVVQSVPTDPIQLGDGIYILCSAADGRVIEMENKRARGSVHVFMANSQHGRARTQLWSICRIPGRDSQYTIRNMALGVALDLHYHSLDNGAHVVAHPAWITAGPHQSWSFHRVRAAGGYVATTYIVASWRS
jgi:hypothetical protein